MCKYKIKLSHIKDVEKLSQLSNKYNATITLDDKNFILENCKSIMRILGVHIQEPVVAELVGEYPKEATEEIKAFLVSVSVA